MVSFSKLAELSSGNIGFAGGSAVDTMPGMSFSECANAFNDYLSEQAIADYEREEACDERLFEAAVMSMQYGDSSILESTMTAINEEDGTGDGEGSSESGDSGSSSDSSSSGAKKTVWERIKGVFKKIADFFKNLLAKFTSWIAMHTKDGKAFYDKYIKQFNESTKTVELKVFPFGQLDKIIDGTFEDVDETIKALVPDVEDIDKVSSEKAKELTPKMKIDRSTIRNKIYETLGAGDKKLEDFIRGESVTKKYSKSNAGEIRKILVEAASIKTVQNSYKIGMQSANDNLRKANSAANEKDDANITAYAKAYSTLFNLVTSETNKVISTVIKCYKKRVMQGKRIMRSVIVGKDVGAEATEAAEGATDTKPEKEEAPAASGKEESVGFDGFDFDL